MRATYRKVGTVGWKGVIKHFDGSIAWECSHVHKNRDQGSWYAGTSAICCARTELKDRESRERYDYDKEQERLAR